MLPIASCPGSRRVQRRVQGRGKARDGKISSWQSSQHSQTPPQKCTERTRPIDPSSLGLGGTNKKPRHAQTAFAASVLPKISLGLGSQGHQGWKNPIFDPTPLITKPQPQTPPSLLLLLPFLSQAHTAPSTPSLEPAPASAATQSSLLVPEEGGPGVLSSCQRVFSTPTRLSRKVGDPSRSPAT